jgi:hypothetical protein
MTEDVLSKQVCMADDGWGEAHGSLLINNVDATY